MGQLKLSLSLARISLGLESESRTLMADPEPVEECFSGYIILFVKNVCRALQRPRRRIDEAENAC